MPGLACHNKSLMNSSREGHEPRVHGAAALFYQIQPLAFEIATSASFRIRTETIDIYLVSI